MRLDLDLERLFEDDKAVSPVIGVILMVAITVILAAVIGTFVLDLGQNVQSNPQAGIAFEEGDLDAADSNTEIRVTVNSVQRADTLTVTCQSGGSEKSLSASAGSSVLCDDSELATTGTVTVTATYEGNTAVIQQRDYDFS